VRPAAIPDTTDEEIDAAVASDPDWAELEPIDWTRAEVVTPPKAPGAFTKGVVIQPIDGAEKASRQFDCVTSKIIQKQPS
jgi:hypothetical protein